ncbi:substrate-binding domain-containing protein [Phycisphaerales bacterium AB-hyl4]|uniref:Substrate-binding domain-containing protein n=1 Tax=Natronomicrosphaera hydrolytica TaxID=3242702 RepID=A0ABV4U7D4_9BACT
MSNGEAITRSESVAAVLRTAIERGTWAVGARLPSTRQLASDHQTSLSTVHSALRELEMLGMVERRARSGIRVARRHPTMAGPRGGSATTTRQVAVVLVRWREDYSDSWSHEAVIETQHCIAAAGFHVLPLFVDPHADDALDQLKRHLSDASASLAGVILINSSLLRDVPSWLDGQETPWVYLNKPSEQAVSNYVGIDYSASFALGHCLARMELSRILALGLTPTGSPTGRAKLTELIRGYMAASGRTPELQCWSSADDPDRAARFAFLCDRLEQPNRPEVIFGSSDAAALQALRACRQVGLDVPGDVRLVGGTGVSFSAHTSPSLTVIGQTARQAARVALDMLQEMVKSGEKRLPARDVPARLAIRDSLPIPDAVLEALPETLHSLVGLHPLSRRPASKGA